MNSSLNIRKRRWLFSGGTDSAFLLYAARSAGADVRPYLVKSQFQPEFEYEDAVRLSGELGAELRVVNADILQYDEVTANPGNRCYFCKNESWGRFAQQLLPTDMRP